MEMKYSGKAKGGYARAAKLTAEERKIIAQKAAKERWEGSSLLKETHKGTLKIGDIKIPCAVLDNGIRVLRERSVATAFGKKGGGAHWKRKKNAQNGALLPEYVSAQNLQGYISDEVNKKLTNPISYIAAAGSKAWGLPAILLPEICDIWLKARENGALSDIQLLTASQAEIILKGFAHIGIIALVDEATGYQEIRPKEALQAYLEMIVRKELAAWAKKFPDEFYKNIYELKGWIWPGMKKNRFSIVARYTTDLVYERIAPDLLQELEKRSPQDEHGRRKNKLHQWLTEDVGNPMLAQHLHSLIMFQRLAISNGFGWKRFVKMVDKVLPKKYSTLELPTNLEPDATEL
ncbi:P63C domain protein [bacterium BMS3Bbin08]|nr:P63C domain protein [bacterium BMS3Bbin08]